jgi:hypothetical protein
VSERPNLLARIPGQYVAEALNKLPAAESTTMDMMEVLINVPGLGAVRIAAKRMKETRGKSTHYFWSAERAGLV